MTGVTNINIFKIQIVQIAHPPIGSLTIPLAMRGAAVSASDISESMCQARGGRGHALISLSLTILFGSLNPISNNPSAPRPLHSILWWSLPKRLKNLLANIHCTALHRRPSGGSRTRWHRATPRASRRPSSRPWTSSPSRGATTRCAAST